MWYYLDAELSDPQVGPVTDSVIFSLLESGKLDTEAFVFHPTHTHGDWMKAKDCEACAVAVLRGKKNNQTPQMAPPAPPPLPVKQEPVVLRTHPVARAPRATSNDNLAAIIVSLFLPGLGHLIQGRILSGVVFLFAFIVLGGGAAFMTFNGPVFFPALGVPLLVYVLGVVDVAWYDPR